MPAKGHYIYGRTTPIGHFVRVGDKATGSVPVVPAQRQQERS